MHLGLRTSLRLRVRVGAAEELLRRLDDRSADLALGDAFEGQEVPSTFGTPEFAATLERVLRPAGVYALNVVDNRGAPVARGHAKNLQSAFAHVALMAPRAILRNRAGGNVIVVASNVRLPVKELAARAAG